MEDNDASFTPLVSSIIDVYPILYLYIFIPACVLWFRYLHCLFLA